MSPILEQLEDRRLFASAVLDGTGLLTVIGDAKIRNDIVLRTGELGLTVDVSFQGAAPQTFLISDISSITVTGAGKTDSITIIELNGAILRPITLFGKRGNDTLKGSISPVTLMGGDQNDKLYGSITRDSINGGMGSDICYGGPGDDFIRGTVGDDRLYGDEGNDDIYGESGDDTLNGGPGSDYMDAASGDDVLSDQIPDAFNSFRGGKGEDLFYISPGDDVQDDTWEDWVYVSHYGGYGGYGGYPYDPWWD